MVVECSGTMVLGREVGVIAGGVGWLDGYWDSLLGYGCLGSVL